MKTIYIPKGETVNYESLVTEHLVVRGCLKTVYGVKAKTISGDGVICAGTISADNIRADELEAAAVTCKRLVAKRVEAPEVFASESAAVSCFLSAAYVEMGKLTVAVSEIDKVVADEVINLPPKKRSLFGTLLASALRSCWMALTTPATVMDAEYRQVMDDENKQDDAQASSAQETATEPVAESVPFVEEPVQEEVDEELNRVVAMFKLLRASGYTLKVVPGTPEENAPVFDFEAERIIRPAA